MDRSFNKRKKKKEKSKLSLSCLSYKFESLQFSCPQGICEGIQDQQIIKNTVRKHRAPPVSHCSSSTRSSTDYFWQHVNMQPVTTLINVFMARKAIIKTTILRFKFNLWPSLFQIQLAEFINQEGNLFMLSNQGQHGDSSQSLIHRALVRLSRITLVKSKGCKDLEEI